MNNKEKTLTLLGFGIAIGFSIAIAVGANATSVTAPETQPPAQASQPESDSTNARETPVTRSVAKVAPSVVSITTEEPSAGLFDRYYRNEEKSGEGSGVIIDPEGIVLTNAHVVANSIRISVGFADSTQSEAVVIGLAEDLDLAVLRVKTDSHLTPVELGTSADLILGEPVIAIGNPFGLGHTVTTGVVSATSRPLETDSQVFQDFIQTDASINPGNSGGPLINSRGQLIGITTAIRPNSEGIGFAIPIDRAYKIARDLLQAGTVQLPFLGVLIEDYRVPTGRTAQTRPMVVANVSSTDFDAALQAGDILESIESRPIQSRADLNAFLASFEPGAQLNITVRREGARVRLNVNSGTVGETIVDHAMKTRLGWSLRDNTLSSGHPLVSISSVAANTSASRIGLRPGDLLIGIDGARVRTAKDAKSAIQRALERHRSSILITVRRGHAQGRVLLPL